MWRRKLVAGSFFNLDFQFRCVCFSNLMDTVSIRWTFVSCLPVERWLVQESYWVLGYLSWHQLGKSSTGLRPCSHVHKYEYKCMSTRKHEIRSKAYLCEAFTHRRVLHESELRAIPTHTSPICTSHVSGSSYEFCLFTLRHLIHHT